MMIRPILMGKSLHSCMGRRCRNRNGCFLRRSASSYMFNPVLCVTLNGQIVHRWVFVVDFTSGVDLPNEWVSHIDINPMLRRAIPQITVNLAYRLNGPRRIHRNVTPHGEWCRICAVPNPLRNAIGGKKPAIRQKKTILDQKIFSVAETNKRDLGKGPELSK